MRFKRLVSRLWNFLSSWQKLGVGSSAFCLKNNALQDGDGAKWRIIPRIACQAPQQAQASKFCGLRLWTLACTLGPHFLRIDFQVQSWTHTGGHQAWKLHKLIRFQLASENHHRKSWDQPWNKAPAPYVYICKGSNFLEGDSWHSSRTLHPRYLGWSGSNKRSPL